MLTPSLVAQTVGQFVFPIPTTNIQIFWTLLGANFGRSFGKKLDQGIQASEWFKSLDPLSKNFVKRVLDFTHHWWIGGLLWLYADAIAVGRLSGYVTEIMFFGYGLLIDDLRDIDNLKRRYGIGNTNGG